MMNDAVGHQHRGSEAVQFLDFREKDTSTWGCAWCVRLLTFPGKRLAGVLRAKPHPHRRAVADRRRFLAGKRKPPRQLSIRVLSSAAPAPKFREDLFLSLFRIEQCGGSRAAFIAGRRSIPLPDFRPSRCSQREGCITRHLATVGLNKGFLPWHLLSVTLIKAELLH